MKAKTQLLTILTLLLLFALPSLVHAQPGFGDPGDDAPIDGGLSLLIAAGTGYGIKKIRQGVKRKPRL